MLPHVATRVRTVPPPRLPVGGDPTPTLEPARPMVRRGGGQRGRWRPLRKRRVALLAWLVASASGADEEQCAFLRRRTRKALPERCGRAARGPVAPLLVTCLGGAGSWQISMALRAAGL